MIPEEPDPVYGAIAGVVSAVGSLFVFAASIGFVFSLCQVSAGGLGGAVSEFVFITGLVAIFGGIVTLPSSPHWRLLSATDTNGTWPEYSEVNTIVKDRGYDLDGDGSCKE
jgi:hypothetical protein